MGIAMPVWCIVFLILLLAPASGHLNCLPCIDRTRVNITAVVHGTQSQSFWLQVQRAAQTAASQMKVNLHFDLLPVYSSSAMAALVRSAAAAQPQALLVSIPNDEVAVAVADVAANTSVPVFSLNAGYLRASGLGSKAHVSMDEIAAGRAVGAEFAAAFAAKGVSLTTCLSINTDFSSIAQSQRTQGFNEWCTSNGARNISTVQVNGDNLIAMGAVLERQFAAMKSAGQLQGLALLCLDDRAVATAVAKLKAALGGQIGANVVGSFEVGDDVYDALATGDLAFSVDQGAWLQGFLPVVLATVYVTTGQIMPVPLYPTGPKIVRQAPAALDQACEENAFPFCSCPWAFGNESSVPTSQCVAPRLLFAAACPCRDARKVNIVGVTHGVTSDTFWHVVRGGAAQAANDFRMMGFAMDFQVQISPEQQAQRILDAAADPQVDGIFVTLPGVYGDAISNATALAAKTKFVVTMNSGSGIAYRLDSTGNLLAHVSMDEYLAGEKAGRVMAARGATKIFCIVHEYGNAALGQRCQGLTDYVQGGGHGTVIVLQMGEEIDTSNHDLIRMYLTGKIAAYPQVDGMLLLGGGQMVTDAVAAMQATRWLISGAFDTSPELTSAMNAGRMHFCIDQLAWMQGYMSVLLLAMRTLTGQSVGVPANKMLPTGPFVLESVDPVALQCQGTAWQADNVGPEYAHSFTVGFPACPFNPLCNPGYAKAPSGECLPCEPGTTSPGGAETQCRACPPGTFADAASGAANCTQCAPGTYSSASKKTGCTFCEAGRFSGDVGAADCTNCAVGDYSDILGSTACASCGEGKLRPWLYSTLQLMDVQGVKQWVPLLAASSPSQCGCAAGAYVVGGECTPCSTGMICRGMGEVLMEEGYFASPDSPGFVFQCFGTSSARCPGGAPGLCAPGRMNSSIACSACEANKYPTDAGACRDCGRTGSVGFAVVAVVLAVGLVSIYRFIDVSDKAARNQAVLVGGLALSQFVTLLQQLGVFSTIALIWPQPFKEVLAVVELFNFDPDILNVDCVQTVGPVAKFFGRIFVVIVFFAALVVIHIVYVLLVHKGRFWTRMFVLADSTGTIFLAFFISVVSTMLAPFQCNRHPNGLSTVRKYPSVVCFDPSYGPEHGAMIAISAVAMLIPVIFLSITLYAVWKYESAMASGNVKFFSSFSFLFFRYRPGAHWYVLVALVRNTGITIVATLGNPTVQIILLESLLLPSLCIIMHFLPWAVRVASYLEAATTLLLSLILVCFALFVQDADGGAVARCCCALVALPVMGMFCTLCWAIYTRFFRRGKTFQFFLCHHKAGAGNFARLLKMSLVESKAVRRRVFLDSDYLLDLDELFGIVGCDTENLVVICSKEILTRPWCMGEVATAMLYKVSTVKVLLQDFLWPEGEFLAQYEEKVPQSAMLAQYAISTLLLREGLEWLEKCASIALPPQATRDVMGSLVSTIVDCHKLKPETTVLIGKSQSDVANHGSTNSTFSGTNTILVDSTCIEMACTAIILQKLLAPLFVSEGLPWVLAGDSMLPENTQQVCLICSNGVFTSGHVVGNLLRAAECGMGVLPIVTETSFRFPTRDFYDHLRVHGDRLLASISSPYSADVLAFVVEQLFREIAVELNPQEAESILVARAQAVANRLQRGAKLRRLRLTEKWRSSVGSDCSSTPRPSKERTDEVPVDVVILDDRSGAALLDAVVVDGSRHCSL